ncbi:keratin, type I cytoskeletal 23 isoform X1 [Phascolarctos cinereus]|uniref:Keratin, type I cytoskeletal 23 isoform X1 n=1 Tax=Phascolarctos cinereus TaxID=38626 RepID=A0A6P5L9D5_PHACI|nr:keratin, type I cytoskeletal 23 isoform X1 [Phascolarctos cinereus]
MSFSQSPFQSPSGAFKGSGYGWARPGIFPRAPSVHGGAGGVQLSISSTTSFCLSPKPGGYGAGFGGNQGGRILTGGNGKQMMQNLNDRLASYLEKVRSLEAANIKLESCILEWHKKRDLDKMQDYSQYEESISHLQEQIMDGKLSNAKILLHIDNARMAMDDFCLKYENELSFKKDLETEVEALRKILDDLTIVRTDLELEVEGMRKELILMKKHHEEEISKQHMTDDIKVNVRVNSTPGEDLMKILEDMRQEYELIIKKKHQDLDTWYKEQSESVSQELESRTASVQSSKDNIHELRRTFQALEIDLQTQKNKKCALEGMLADTQSRYSCQLQDIQQIISHYEEELMQLRHDLERQNNEYKILLDIKNHLENEIATYRHLMEGKDKRKTEDYKTELKAPKIKAIMQETVNGRVILSKVNEIQKPE